MSVQRPGEDGEEAGGVGLGEVLVDASGIVDRAESVGGAPGNPKQLGLAVQGYGEVGKEAGGIGIGERSPEGDGLLNRSEAPCPNTPQ